MLKINIDSLFREPNLSDTQAYDVVWHKSQTSFLGKVWSTIKLLFKYKTFINEDKINKFINQKASLETLRKIHDISQTMLAKKSSTLAQEKLLTDKSVVQLKNFDSVIIDLIEKIQAKNQQDNKIVNETTNTVLPSQGDKSTPPVQKSDPFTQAPFSTSTGVDFNDLNNYSTPDEPDLKELISIITHTNSQTTSPNLDYEKKLQRYAIFSSL